MHYSNRASLLRIIGGHLVSSSSSSSSSSRLFLLNGSRNIINAGSFSSSSSIRGNSHFFSRTNEEEEEEARRTRRRGYGSTIPSTSYETRGRGEGGGRLRREQLGNTSRNRFCFSTCTFLARGRGAAAAAAEQEQQREQLDDATTTAETTVKPKRKTKKQLKEDEFISNVLVPGLRRFYAEFKHLNVPKGYEFSKDGEVEEEEKKEEEEEEQTPRSFGRAVHNFRVRRGRASLTEAQLKALDAVGAETGERFVWDNDEFVFEKQIVPGLVLFKEKFGHMNVPHKYCVDGVDVESSENEALRKPYLKDFPLGAKVNDMRAKGTYILHQPQRLETLALLGFVWDDDQFRFEEMLVPAAVAYRQYCKRKLVENYSAERKRFPKKMFTRKHFKFLLPWTAVITAVEQTTTTKENNDVDDEEEGKEDKVDDKSEEQNLRDIPEFQSLLLERPYLDGYALGNVARCAHREHEKQSKTMIEVSDDNDNDDNEIINRSMGWLKTATVPQPPRNTQPKQERAINQTTKKKKLFIDGRAERILRMLKTLGAVFDEEKDVILTESFEERDKGGTRQRRRKKKKEIEKSLSL